MSRVTSDWVSQLFASQPDEAWAAIFAKLEEIVPRSHDDLKAHYQGVEAQVEKLDRLLSSSAWELWRGFKAAAKGSAAVKSFWVETVGPKAVLILDSLSLREVAPLLMQAQAAGCEVVSVNFAGSEIPSETDLYAEALGLSGRASLKKKPLPASFTCTDKDTHVDTLQLMDFAQTADKIPNSKNVFLWHGWPDDLLHDLAKAEDAFNKFIEQVKGTIDSDGFRSVISKLARGRELLITSDHGYCNASGFISAQGESHQALKFLGHTRARKLGAADSADPRVITPPPMLDVEATSTSDRYRVALGRLRPSDKGYPALTHGGMSLLECTVPVIRLRGGSNG